MNPPNAQSVSDTVLVGTASQSNWPAVLGTSHLRLPPACCFSLIALQWKIQELLDFTPMLCAFILTSSLIASGKEKSFFFFLFKRQYKPVWSPFFASWTRGLALKKNFFLNVIIIPWLLECVRSPYEISPRYIYSRVFFSLFFFTSSFIHASVWED